MSTSQNPVTGRVAVGGDELFYEVRGSGEPLLMIAPGGGDGWQYARVADLLSNHYRVIAYDRRANGRSTMNGPQNFTIQQQSDDAAAILKAVGEESAHVFGNSSGAVIALDLAIRHPERARVVVAHEAPLPRLHPRAERWQTFFADVYLTSFRFGPSWAALQFMLGAQLPVRALIGATREVNAHRKASAEPYLSDRTATEVLTRWELLPVTNYLPDIEALKRSGVRLVVAVGEWGLKKRAWYVEADKILAERVGCELKIFPGHHGGFLDQPEAFAAALRSALKRDAVPA